MNAILKAAVLPALALAAAGCQVNVDENTAARIDNAADRLENVAEGAAAATENAAEGAAATVEGAADRIDDVDVDVGVRAEGGNDSAAAANKQ
jgi:hypothetical protein